MSEPMFTATLYGTVQKAQAAQIEYLTRELAERETQLASIQQLLEDAEARASTIDPSWSLRDRVEFALRDAGFALDEASRVAYLAVIPDGWVAVPVEPTERMVQACGSRSVVPCYKAMLSARPELPKESENE